VAMVSKPSTPPVTSPPILQLDPGGHKALIMDIAFTPDGKYLISASNDKTIRVWDLAQPGTARILRGQIGAGDEGKIYAMALAPDGRTLAVGDLWQKDMEYNDDKVGDIRLQDLATGRILGLLRGHTNVILMLSPLAPMVAIWYLGVLIRQRGFGMSNNNAAAYSRQAILMHIYASGLYPRWAKSGNWEF